MTDEKLKKYTDFKKKLQEKIENGTISTDEYERRIIKYCEENKI